MFLFLGMALGVGRHIAEPYSWADVEWSVHSLVDGYRWRRVDRRFKRRKRRREIDLDDE